MLRPIGIDLPFWDDYRELMERALDACFPDIACLNRLLPPVARSGAGAQIRFVPASRLPGVAYERHIFETGEVSTREKSRHDLFNALVWCRLPRFKAAMNALHYGHIDEEHAGRRGPLRDALTLLDESGVLVVASNRRLLQALAERDWRRAFCEHRPDWPAPEPQEGAAKQDPRVRVVICGHALLEKLCAPYKAITAHALLLHVAAARLSQAGEDFLSWLDRELAERMPSGLCTAPAALSPLPLAGIPGWWPDAPQDSSFYDDSTVFRLPPPGLTAAPVHRL